MITSRRRRGFGSVIPTAPTVAYRDPCGIWTLLARCPHCGAQETHPAGTGDAPEFGLKRPRCRTGDVYWAMPTD
ncbi:hypothetical protein [Streptomyces sp. NPDC002082]|uniref:hypothetical protein n=1 Tax=Streptomyces sp. NPDC002082 TaxID=3154772 RepID=UPI00332F37BB